MVDYQKLKEEYKEHYRKLKKDKQIFFEQQKNASIKNINKEWHKNMQDIWLQIDENIDRIRERTRIITENLKNTLGNYRRETFQEQETENTSPVEKPSSDTMYQSEFDTKHTENITPIEECTNELKALKEDIYSLEIEIERITQSLKTVKTITSPLKNSTS